MSAAVYMPTTYGVPMVVEAPAATFMAPAASMMYAPQTTTYGVMPPTGSVAAPVTVMPATSMVAPQTTTYGMPGASATVPMAAPVVSQVVTPAQPQLQSMSPDAYVAWRASIDEHLRQNPIGSSPSFLAMPDAGFVEDAGFAAPEPAAPAAETSASVATKAKKKKKVSSKKKGCC